MYLSETQRKYLVQDQIIGSAVFNALLNALLAWMSLHKLASVPMTGNPSIVGDAIVTAILLPLLTCLIVTPLVRKAIKAGKVTPLSTPSPGRSMVLWLPSLSFFRGLVLALGVLATCTPALLGLLVLAGVEQLSVGAFIFIKTIYAAVMAGLVAPVIALYVMASESKIAVEPAFSKE
jgi:hypothetical protein